MLTAQHPHKAEAKVNDNQPGGKKGIDPCTKQFKDFFSNLDLYKDVANKLNTNPEFVMAHSSWESGWLGPHAKELHNIFGLTHGGKKNLRFDTYQEGADVYVKTVQGTVSGAATIDDFGTG